jgi:hypothetical protein
VSKRLHVKYPLFLSDFNKTFKPLNRFSKNINFMKTRPVGAELFHVDGRTDRRNTIDTFRNFANACEIAPNKTADGIH